MKKFLTVLLVAILAFGLVACGGTKDEGGSSTDGDVDVIRVALLLPFIGDQSYFDVTYNGLALLKDVYGDKIETTLIEMGEDQSSWEVANRQAAEAGYDIIISGNWQYEGAMLTVAAEYPDIKFLNFDFSDAEANSLDNVYAISYAAHEIGYLAGVVAAVKSETGIIGGVGGMDNHGIRQFMAGYMQGAYDVNPDIKVIISYVGSFTDMGAAKEITLNMIAQGADVVWGCAGGAGNGVFVAASESEGVWAIGVDTDQYVSLSDQPALANTILTSGLKKCDQGILDAVTAIINGTAPYGTQKVLTFADNGIGLAENDYYLANMSEEELAIVEEYTSKVLTGETTVIDALQDPSVYEDILAKVTK